MDRFTARLGAAPIVAGRPGMGWLLTECIPVFMWAQVTGALLGESFYLVTYLTLLGATASTLALLPLVVYAGNACSSLLVFARHHGDSGRDAKRRCIVDTGVGRFFWLGTVAWPLLGLQLGWSPTTQLSGVFAFIFLAQFCHAAGGASFVVWTQAVVPRPLRGRFYVWRNCASFAATALVVVGMGLVLPKGSQATHEQLPWLMGIFAAITVLCLASTWMLTRCPDVPLQVQERPRPPLREAFAQARGYGPLVVFNICTVGAMAISMAYLPTLIQARGVDTATFAAAHGAIFFPALLGGIFLAGWGLGRLGGRRLLMVTAALLLTADGAFLLLPNAAWLAPCLVLSGISKGLWGIALIGRQQELCPAGDTRFPALMVGCAALGAILIAIALRLGVPLLESHVVEVAWTLVAGAAGLRIIALIVLLIAPVDRARPG